MDKKIHRDAVSFLIGTWFGAILSAFPSPVIPHINKYKYLQLLNYYLINRITIISWKKI
jgi:hypothetical protein